MHPRPNILVTGTPGVGKSTFCRQLAGEAGLEHIELSRLVEEEQLYTERDVHRGCTIFDEELLLSNIEDTIHDGNKLVDFHSCDFFPDDWFDLICVLRADTEQLYDRLENRHYDQEKIGENVQCEIFRVLLDEALETFGSDKVRELSNNTPEELDDNVETVSAWLREWKPADKDRETRFKGSEC
ncbi:UNVERIFIED_CONTAM: hypothetical protein H355_013336 [Colinus virginianus]|nr:hypothetical protein H355_013336 [Colinus virginianus]